MSRMQISNQHTNALSELILSTEPESSKLTNELKYNVLGWTWSCDHLGNYFFVSQEVETVLGIAPHQFIGQSLQSFKLSKNSALKVDDALKETEFPIEVDVIFKLKFKNTCPAKLYIYKGNGNGFTNNQCAFYGFTNVLLNDTEPYTHDHPELHIPKQLEESHKTKICSIIEDDLAANISNLPIYSNTLIQIAIEFCDAVIDTRNLTTLLQFAVDTLCDRLGLYHCAIYLIDENQHEAILRYCSGEQSIKIREYGVHFSTGSNTVVGFVASAGVELMINDIETEPLFQYLELLPLTQSEVCIPLIAESTILGILDIQNKHVNTFSCIDYEVLKLIARQISVMIYNHRTYQLSLNAIHEARNAEKSKSGLIEIINSEFHGTLSSIIGYSRVILNEIDGPITELQRDDLTEIYNLSYYLLNQVNNLIDYSKINSGALELSFENNVHIEDIFNNIQIIVSGQLREKSIQLITSTPPHLPDIRVDPVKVQQVIFNLISNAITHTENGLITLSANLTNGSNDDPFMIIEVSDNGTGIPIEEHERIFNPISNPDEVVRDSPNGRGIGLPISMQLVKMHGGEIGFKSEENKGSRFFFTLPVTNKNPYSSIIQNDRER